MSNMAEVNGTDHLVRHEKETRLNGYDNEGYHSQERSEDEEESASDDDRLRVVVTENGHRPEDDSHLSNGYVHEETNGHPTTVNGSAVIVLEESKGDSNMGDGKDGSSQKPLDTRLHHYVPVDDIDRKILNGSDTTHVTIPEDAVISFTTGRVKVKKGASSNPPVSNERESIPLETMLPSYEGEDKTGLGEKAELEAELANHKNGLWSEGHNAYSSPEGPFGNSEKLNGTSKSGDEVSLPVNNHRKCLSSDVSDTSSEQKATGEKLYFTDENRKLCPGWRRVFVCGLILIILAVALLLGVLAATGILLAESESKNTRYESGHSLPSIDSISHAGQSFRPRPHNSKVPQKFLPPVTGNAPLPPNSTFSGMGDTVSRPPPTVSSKVPVLNDSSHSQTIVPNALVGEFIIDENFTEDLKDSTSDGYRSVANYIEKELRGIFKRNGGMFEELKILRFSPGSIKVKFVTIWASDHNVILSQKAVEIMKSYLRKNRNSLLAYPVDLNSIHFKDVFDECRVQKGGCSYNCVWDYNTLTKLCTCQENMMLLADGKSCSPKPLTSEAATTTPKLSYRSTSTTSTSAIEPPVLTTESTKTAAVHTSKDFLTTTQIPTTLTEAITTISELLNDLTTTESVPDINEASPTVQIFTTLNEPSPSSSENVTEPSISEETTTTIKDIFTTDNPEITDEVITEIPIPTNSQNHSDFYGFNTTENLSTVLELASPSITTSDFELDITTQKSTISTSNDTELYTAIPDYIENQNESTTVVLPTTEPYTFQEEAITTIGYHIEEETTKIYTLKESTDFDLETTHTTILGSNNVSHEEAVTFTETSFLVTSNRATVPEEMKELFLTTEIPTTEVFTNMATTEMTSYNATEMSMHDNITEIHDFPPMNTIINVEDLQYNTTITDGEDKFTNIGDLKEAIDYTTSATEISDINDVPSFLLNETKDFQETPPATTPFVTSIFSVPPVIPQFNRTPGVRSFDEDFENNTFTPTDSFITEAAILAASTEINTYTDNSSATESKVDTLPTSSPVTTSLADESLFDTTLSVNTSEESDSLETVTNIMNDSINENKVFSNTEIATSPFTEPTRAFTNFSGEDAESLSNIESTLELSTQNSHSFGVVDNITGETVNTTVLFNENNYTTLGPTEMESLNDTLELTENFGAIISDVTQSSTEMNTTITTVDTSENNSLDAFNTTEMPESTSLSHETVPTDLFETASNVAINSNLNLSKNDSDSEYSNSSVELEDTENPLLLITTLEPMDFTSNQSGFDSDILTTVPSISHINESNIFTEEVIGNATEFSNFTNLNETDETYTLTTVQDYTFPTPPTYSNETETNTTTEPIYDSELLTTLSYSNGTLFPGEIGYDSNFTHTISMSYESFDGVYSTLLPEMNSTLVPGMNESVENSTFIEDFGNFTTDDYEDVTNETTTNASTGIECREDQFLCEPLNKCINDTFMCDGIEDCPGGQDEFECKDTCQSNFMCGNSSTCIMSDARCDGIWDCENGTDEENCTPTECAKHEVMCLDGSKCIKPGHICDWKYNCLDRSDEVGCVERTTCESGGRFFCNDGLCIPWSLKCDGEHDCKDGEDEGNCTCLNGEFQCNDGKCLKSSSRCDGHQDCHDADDEMGCVNVDSQHIVSTYEPYSGSWGLLCAEDWTLDDGQYLCQELGFGHALSVERVHVSFNHTWMAMRRDNLTDTSLWTERVSFVESCTSSLAAAVECQKFACGEYTGLLHRRRRDVISSSSSQWPFIGYTSTFHSSKGCLSEILTPIWLITSAECLLSISKEPFNGSDWYVRTNIGRKEEVDVTQNHEVLRIINHPHSSKFRSLTLRDYDVALIRLKHALVFVSDKIGAICPPDEQVPPGITCFSGVLGTEKPRAPPPQTLTINSLALQIIDKRNCNKVEHYNNAINQRMLCTQSSEGHTICDNDEGTPLMCLTGINKWFLAGMLTYQRFCDVYSKHPAVFSNLFSMRKFLDQVTGQKQYEVPYDGDVYVIIPPTTPSPTMPETTTAVMTTITTTELPLLDTTDLTTEEAENETETMFQNFEAINGTTALNEELVREENYTTMIPVEFITDLINSTAGEMLKNETDPVLYGMDLNVINTTMEEAEIARDEFLTNRTHSYLMSLLNDTYTSDDINITDVSISDNSTDFNNITSDLLELSTVLVDLTDQPISTELSNATTESYDISLTTITHNDQILNSFINETKDTTVPLIPVMNETTDNPQAVSSLTDSTDTLNLSDVNNTITTDLPLISIFNESLEMFEPIIALTNESVAVSQPLISLINDTAEMGIEYPASLLTTEPSENISAKNMTTEANNSTFDQNTSVETTEIPTMKLMPIEARAEYETTTSAPLDATETFTFELEGEPVADLAFYIFNNSDGLKFEPYSLPENNNSSDISRENKSIAEIQDTNLTTDFPSANETLTLSSNISSIFNVTESPSLILNKTEGLNTESETAAMNYTSSVTFEVDTKSETVVNASLLNTENYENVTEMPEIELGITGTDDSKFKAHLISEELTVLQDDDSLNITDCGLWDENSGIFNNSDSKNFFRHWPALGFLQMISEPKMCTSAVISPKFVITSLNCISLRDNQLDPDNWAYVGGLYHSNNSSNGTQNHLVSKIIPYPDQSVPLFFHEHDVALVKVKDTIKMDQYSKNACVAKDVLVGRNCFTTGWSKNFSDGDIQKDFYSIPLSTISSEECNNTINYNGMLLNNLICGSNNNESIKLCQMDLGSPLFCLNENKHWELQGILNFPGSCDMAQPPVFNSIASIRKWILDTLTNDEKLLL